MPICDRSVQDLRRHVITTHKHNKRVKAIINDESSGRITEQQRIHAFNQLKKEGIQQKNRCILGDNGHGLNGERRSQGRSSPCYGFYKKEYLYRHCKHCPNAIKVTVTVTSSTPTMSTTEPDEEWGRDLEGTKKESGYVSIIVDDVIRVSRRDMFAARKPNKKREEIVKARRAMRRVARLKLAVRVNSSQELFFIEIIIAAGLPMST